MAIPGANTQYVNNTYSTVDHSTNYAPSNLTQYQLVGPSLNQGNSRAGFPFPYKTPYVSPQFSYVPPFDSLNQMPLVMSPRMFMYNTYMMHNRGRGRDSFLPNLICHVCGKRGYSAINFYHRFDQVFQGFQGGFQGLHTPSHMHNSEQSTNTAQAMLAV